jgi:hypothetical protein
MWDLRFSQQRQRRVKSSALWLYKFINISIFKVQEQAEQPSGKQSVKDEDNTFLWNAGKLLPGQMQFILRQQYSSLYKELVKSITKWYENTLSIDDNRIIINKNDDHRQNDWGRGGGGPRNRVTSNVWADKVGTIQEYWAKT